MAREITITHRGGVTPVLIGEGLLPGIGQLLAERFSFTRVAVVSDETVEKLYLDPAASALKDAGFKVEAFVFPAGEATKSFASLEALLKGLLDFGMEKGDAVVALGGGVIGDLAGLAASLVKRGVATIQVPTTVLSQVDSAFGGKTGINTRHGKNMIGATRQPELVLADVAALKTLNDKEFRSGYAEVVKHAVISGDEAMAHLEDTFDGFFAKEPDALMETISRSVTLKAAVIAGDEADEGARMRLNLGHTFGHALELLGDYEALSHGEAVAIGMMAAFEYGLTQGGGKKADMARLAQHLEKAGLPTNLKGAKLKASREDIFNAMKHDKKRKKGAFRLIAPYGFGDVAIEEVAAAALDAFVKKSAILGR